MGAIEIGELRWALIFLGGVVLLFIWAWEMRGRWRQRRAAPRERHAHGLGEDEPDAAALRAELAQMSELLAEDRPRRASTGPEAGAGPPQAGAASEARPARSGSPAAAATAPPAAVPPRDRPQVPTATPGRRREASGSDQAPGSAAPRDPERGSASLTPQHPKPRPAAPARPSAPGPELIIVLYVVAKSTPRLAGTDILEALADARLEYGRMRVFHRTGPDGREVFSVADMVEPGSLEPDRLKERATRGLCLFMRLPGPADGVAAFQDMLQTAHRLAQRLGGELRDDRRSVLTRQAVERLRERIDAQRRQAALAQGKPAPSDP
jgi:cell division protein ZipA